MHRVSKDQLKELKKLLGSTHINLPGGDRVNVGALCDLALRQIAKEKPAPRRFRFADAGEVTVWQKQVVLQSGLAPAGGGARLVWVANADVLDLGQEVKQPENQ